MISNLRKCRHHGRGHFSVQPTRWGSTNGRADLDEMGRLDNVVKRCEEVEKSSTQDHKDTICIMMTNDEGIKNRKSKLKESNKGAEATSESGDDDKRKHKTKRGKEEG